VIKLTNKQSQDANTNTACATAPLEIVSMAALFENPRAASIFSRDMTTNCACLARVSESGNGCPPPARGSHQAVVSAQLAQQQSLSCVSRPRSTVRHTHPVHLPCGGAHPSISCHFSVGRWKERLAGRTAQAWSTASCLGAAAGDCECELATFFFLVLIVAMMMMMNEAGAKPSLSCVLLIVANHLNDECAVGTRKGPWWCHCSCHTVSPDAPSAPRNTADGPTVSRD